MSAPAPLFVIGAGPGVGTAVARRFARAGHPVGLVARNAERLATTTREFAAAGVESAYALADARPASRKFARRRDGGKGGWITRAEEFISPRYHLTDAQHRARTAGWR